MVKIGVIGMGGMGKGTATTLKLVAEAELVGVYDLDAEVTQIVAKDVGVTAFPSLESLLAKVDAVAICAPTFAHKECTLAAAEAGKHIICEKPMANTVADCREMIDAAEKAGVKLLIGQVLRFFPEFVKLRDMVLAGEVGTPAIVRTTRASRHPKGKSNWFADIERSGGVVLDMGVHDYDWLRWTFGEVERVYAKGLAYHKPDNVDYALTTLRFRSGVIAHVETSWAHRAVFHVMVEVAGDKGLVDFDNYNDTSVTYVVPPDDGTIGRIQIVPTPADVPAHRREIEHFIDVIVNDVEPRIEPIDGLRAVEICQAALESIRTGTAVQL